MAKGTSTKGTIGEQTQDRHHESRNQEKHPMASDGADLTSLLNSSTFPDSAGSTANADRRPRRSTPEEDRDVFMSGCLSYVT